ncbi:MAG: MerR family transcriptional regulator, partial [Gemmatimonadaceae bacterium]|nr:MerR family transcriptional regulator [Gemmatimonadaceae bacterium]
MHIDELRAQFGLSRKTIHAYVAKGLIPPPRGIGRWAIYGGDHVEA